MIVRRRSEITRNLTGGLRAFRDYRSGIEIRHAGWLPDDVASIDEEIDTGHE